MVWAAMNLCFFVFLCSREICCSSTSQYDQGSHLSSADLAVDSLSNPTRLHVRIKASKTDTFRLGVTLVLGATQHDLSPLAAILPYGGQALVPCFSWQTQPF